MSADGGELPGIHIINVTTDFHLLKFDWYISGTINNDNDAHNKFLNDINTYDIDIDKSVELKTDYPYFDIEPTEIHAKLILPEITNNTDVTIKYTIGNKELNTKLTAKINPSSYPQEYIKFTADNVLPKGLSLAEDGTITGTIEEEFDPFGFNTTDVIVSYPGAEDEEITITWEYVEPVISAVSNKTIEYIQSIEITPFEVEPEIGPSEFYTDKTKFTYDVASLPPGITYKNDNGKLTISGTLSEEFDPWGSNTSTVTIKYPDAEDKKLTITWVLREPEIKVETPVDITYTVGSAISETQLIANVKIKSND